jgi:hypothetical protein
VPPQPVILNPLFQQGYGVIPIRHWIHRGFEILPRSSTDGPVRCRMLREPMR